MNEQAVLGCWRCGAALVDVPVPFGRQAYCPQCRADLHVCRMCLAYDKGSTDLCSEDLDDVPRDKERANFCDHFKANPQAFQPQDDGKAREARAGLEALFGMPGEEAQTATDETAETAEERARRELEALFKPDKKD